MLIAVCQLNPVMGDIAGNCRKLRAALDAAAPQAPRLAVFPELFIQGYPPRDLLENQWFVDRGIAALSELCDYSRRCPELGILVGTAMPQTTHASTRLANSAVLINNGEIRFRQDKTLLPAYDVFDESRYFSPASSSGIFEFAGERLGITICEDAWSGAGIRDMPAYCCDPVAACAAGGATLLLNISGSPFHLGKQRLRFSLMQNHARRHGLPLVFVNQVGGNDELIFDGTSLSFDASGGLQNALPAFEESVTVVDTRAAGALPVPASFDTIDCVHDALVLGVRDYLGKCGFTKALVGLSGGIDSAVTCALAAAALGPENVLGVTMPSRYSSAGSAADSEQLAKNLGIEFKQIPIEPMFRAFLQTLQPHFQGRDPDITEENLQARIRGNILMALSNKFGYLLLSTGNKSEMAVGYCTLYGDMDGGLSVISDLPKSMVYRLALRINRQREIIPRPTISKPPSAELRPGQKDQDTLPPYEVLDDLLTLLIEERFSRRELLDKGFEPATIDWAVRAIARSEYKRRQAAPGLKVTPKAFGSGRRFPVAARYEF